MVHCGGVGHLSTAEARDVFGGDGMLFDLEIQTVDIQHEVLLEVHRAKNNPWTLDPFLGWTST